VSSYVALLRGVNLGQRQLRMEDLREIAGSLGLEDPRTYIASGNLLFRTSKREATLKRMLESAIAAHMSASVGVMIRTSDELAEAAEANPFTAYPANRVVAIFLDNAPPPDALEQARNVADEKMALGKREIYVLYPSGQGRSKLRIPAAVAGTARNMNTVAKLAQLSREKS
jgi:uncharacterized protein (DUF1697 family)